MWARLFIKKAASEKGKRSRCCVCVLRNDSIKPN